MGPSLLPNHGQALGGQGACLILEQQFPTLDDFALRGTFGNVWEALLVVLTLQGVATGI